MTAQMTAEIAYDPTRHQLVVRHLDLNEKNYGHLRLCLGIDRFNPKEVTDLRFEPLIIRQMNLEYQDETLLKRLVAGDSKHLLDFRQFMTQAAQLEINAAEEQGDLNRAAALSGLQDFFEAPGRLNIILRLVKTMVLSSDKTYFRKIEEAVLACQLEKRLSKEQILSIYLNEIYMGAGAYGVETAARTYFNKPAHALSLAEAALLAGLPKALIGGDDYHYTQFNRATQARRHHPTPDGALRL
jgi:hypothetical protein